MKIKESTLVGILNRKEGNPRNSEGSFLMLKDGRIAFAYSRYFGNSDHDNADCNICVVYSYDGGKTFDTEHYETMVQASDFHEKNVMSVTLRYMNNGDIGVFYMVKHAGPTSEFYLRRYRDDFAHPLGDTKCFPFSYESYFTVNNDRVLHLSDGTWMIPAAYFHTSTRAMDGSDGYYSNFYFDMRAIVYFFVSKDDGRTWTQQKETLRLADTYSDSGLQEPGLVELPGGVLYCYSRTDRFVQYESVSIDGGEHWFAAQPSKFTSPDSPMLIKKNPYSGKYYAVWNPNPITPVHPRGRFIDAVWGREPLVMAESEDGVHFAEPVFIEVDPMKGYCYPALEFLDEKTMLLAYCSGGVEEGVCLNRTVIRRLIIE